MSAPKTKGTKRHKWGPMTTNIGYRGFGVGHTCTVCGATKIANRSPRGKTTWTISTPTCGTP